MLSHRDIWTGYDRNACVLCTGPCSIAWWWNRYPTGEEISLYAGDCGLQGPRPVEWLLRCTRATHVRARYATRTAIFVLAVFLAVLLQNARFFSSVVRFRQSTPSKKPSLSGWAFCFLKTGPERNCLTCAMQPAPCPACLNTASPACRWRRSAPAQSGRPCPAACRR